MTDYVSFNALTADGQRVIDYIESQLSEAVKQYNETGDLGVINALSGYLKHYYVNVYEAKIMDAFTWARDYTGGMNGAYRDMEYLREQKEQAETLEATQEETKSLAEQIAELQKQLTEAVEKQQSQAAEIEALKEAKNAPVKRGRKAKDAEPAEPAAEPAAEGDTDETTDESDD